MGYYEAGEVGKLEDIEMLKEIFPDGQADIYNFVLFSTSGAHGTYCTLDNVEETWEEGEDEKVDSITVLVIKPRIVQMLYGNIEIEDKNDLAYLRKLAETSFKAIEWYKSGNVKETKGGK